MALTVYIISLYIYVTIVISQLTELQWNRMDAYRNEDALLNAAHTSLWAAHAWLFKIDFVQKICMHTCVSTPKAIINN